MTTRHHHIDICDACGDDGPVAYHPMFGGFICDDCFEGKNEKRLDAETDDIGPGLPGVRPWKRHELLGSFEALDSPGKFLVAFDCDDTLYDWARRQPVPEVVALLKSFAALEYAKVLIWSYGGKQHALTVARMCGVEDDADFIDGKTTWRGPYPDLAVDDNGIGIPGAKTWLFVDHGGYAMMRARRARVGFNGGNDYKFKTGHAPTGYIPATMRLDEQEGLL